MHPDIALTFSPISSSSVNCVVNEGVPGEVSFTVAEPNKLILPGVEMLEEKSPERSMLTLFLWESTSKINAPGAASVSDITSWDIA